MIKCICRRPCQVRVNGHIVTFAKNDIRSFEECPPNFEALTRKAVDFDTAEEAELKERDDYEVKDLKAYILENYDIEVAKNATREKTVDALMDARFRALDKHEVEGVL